MGMVITEKHCFYPDDFEYLTPERWGLNFDDFEFNGPKGNLLTGWHIPPATNIAAKGKTVLHLHGNAQNMTAHLLGSYFLALEGFRLITFDYRGYGRSKGKPTLAGIIDDGKAIIQYLLDNPFGQGEPLALFGQSMGAFTTAHALPIFPGLDRAILEAGLVSFRELFVEAYPEAEVRVPSGFSTLKPLAASSVPKLFIHGTADTIVPTKHSERMHQAAAPPKELMILSGVGHIDALDSWQADQYRERVLGFFAE